MLLDFQDRVLPESKSGIVKFYCSKHYNHYLEFTKCMCLLFLCGFHPMLDDVVTSAFKSGSCHISVNISKSEAKVEVKGQAKNMWLN